MSKTVLLVEDDKLIRENLARVLKEKGLNVVEADNGKVGLAKAVAGGVDLVVTDVHMPEMDGVQMLEALRQDPKGKDLPAIILTVDEQPSTLNQALKAGVTVYLGKTNQDPEALASQIVAAAG